MKKLPALFRYLILNPKRVWLTISLIFCCIWLSLPMHLFVTPTSYVLEDSTGRLLSASIATDGQWRFPQSDSVPYRFAACITTFEDKRFWHHPGIDPAALLRAFFQNITTHRVVSGGSTLSMQVLRLSSGNTSRNIWSKMQESISALKLECRYSKSQILALYAANAPFGGNVVGLEAASWRYYGRAAAQLSWGEMAALAVLPNAPSLVHPGKNRGILLRKRNFLLQKLTSAGIIDKTTAQLAQAEPLPGVPKALPQLAPHLLDRFRKDAETGKWPHISTRLRTTLDGDLQEEVNGLLQRYHQVLSGNQIQNIAALVVKVKTGDILAYVGNVYQPEDSSIESHVDVLNSVRSPGSTLKPLLYAALLTQGSMLPQQLVPDIPTRINGYAPENFDLGYDGAVPANRALARSLNIPAVKMLQAYKYQRFYHLLQQCGVTTLTHPPDYYGMSLIQGGCEINPCELAGIYASMARIYLNQDANKGKWNTADWHALHYGEPFEKPRTHYDANPLFDYTALWHTFNAMNEVMRPGEEGLWSYFQSAQRIAWKTGTSFGFRDGWAVGFNTEYCVLVWVGNTSGEGRPNLTGINTAAPILFDIFRMLPQGRWFRPPDYDFTYLPVCRQTGYKAGPHCPQVDTMLISSHGQQAPVCPYHRIIHLDPSGHWQVTGNCVSPSAMLNVPWFVLPPTMEYYYRQHHTDYHLLPPFMPGCAPAVSAVLEIVYPEEGARIEVPRELNGQKGQTVFTATSSGNTQKLFWSLDNEFVGETERFHQISLNPSPGTHVLTIVDEAGNEAVRHFEIVEKE